MANEPHVIEVGGQDGVLLVIHGGAGKRDREDTPEEQAQADEAMQRALAAGFAKLEAGEPALEAVIAASKCRAAGMLDYVERMVHCCEHA